MMQKNVEDFVHNNKIALTDRHRFQEAAVILYLSAVCLRSRNVVVPDNRHHQQNVAVERQFAQQVYLEFFDFLFNSHSFFPFIR